MKKPLFSISFITRKWRLAIALGALMLLSAAVSGQPVHVKDIYRTSHSFVSANGQLYYASYDSLFTAAAGTVTYVRKLNGNINQISEATIGNKVFIVTTVGNQESLWVSAGSAASTVRIATYPSINPLIARGSDLYLGINDGSHGLEVWKLSNTNTLSMLKDINPGPASGHGGFQFSITASNNHVFFSAHDGSGKDIWSTDGTTAGTTKAVDMPFDRFYQLTDVNGTIFFGRDSVVTEEGPEEGTILAELWKTMGTAGSTQLVKSFGYIHAYNYLTHFTVLNGKLFFIHEHGVPFMDLMVSDGTEGGTVVVKEEINADGAMRAMVAFQNYVAYYGHSQGFAVGIEKSDGTLAGTSEVKRLNHVFTSDGSGVLHVDLTVAGDRLFFVDHAGDGDDYPANEDERYLLYESKADYNPSTTKTLQELYNFPYNNTKNVTFATGNSIFFTTQNSANTIKLWLYDPDHINCAGTGGLTREVWTNISGQRVDQIPLNTPPTRVEKVTSFAGPVNEADNYGARYSGYLCVPVTGNYKFFIASDDYSELWLSTTSSNADKRLIAFVYGSTKRGEYTKYPSQQSDPAHLTQGTLYYIEAKHKEGSTYDHITVAMQYPDGTMENPILGTHLVPSTQNKLPAISITSPADRQEFSVADTVNVNASASDEDGSIVKVEFYVEGGSSNEMFGVDDEAPYEATWGTEQQGTFKLTAKAYDTEGGLSEASIRIIVRNCSATGRILREVWTNAPGLKVSDIPVNRAPNSTGYLTIFETMGFAEDLYGARISGYLCVPTSGEYTFYISSDDHSELWLSDGSDPAKKTRIAYVNGVTNRRQWDKYPSQKSAKIYMIRNRKYYVEVLHKENRVYDHMAVGWDLPNGISERPIPGTRLSPFESSSTLAATIVASGDPVDESSKEQMLVSLTPNPVTSGKVELRTHGLKLLPDSKTVVQVISLTGEVVYTREIFCGSDCENVELDLSGQVRPGIYLVRGSAGGRVFSQRMVVE